MKKTILAAMIPALSLFCIAAQAAPTYSFTNITNNDAGNAAIGEAQLFVELFDLGPGQINFTFTNIGPAASSITDVYYDDGVLLGIASIINTPGSVEFSQLASPPDLPGGILRCRRSQRLWVFPPTQTRRYSRSASIPASFWGSYSTFYPAQPLRM